MFYHGNQNGKLNKNKNEYIHVGFDICAQKSYDLSLKPTLYMKITLLAIIYSGRCIHCKRTF